MSGRFSHGARHGAVVLLLAGLVGCGGGAPTEQAAACPAPTPEPLVGTKLATVDGQQVGSVAWESFSARKSPADGSAWSADEKKQVLDEAIDDEVLFQAAFDRGLYQDPKVRKILVNLLLRQEVYEKVKNEDFTDADLQAYFDQHKEEFVVPAKAQLKRIFVAANDRRTSAEAQKLAEELRAKVAGDPEKTWRDVAMTSSEDPFGKRGGDVGYVDPAGKPGVPDEVVAKAFQLEPGTVSEAFEAGGGWNVIYVPNRRDRIERTFDQMRGAVLRRMKNEKYEELTNQFVAKLRTDAKIAVDDAALAGWTPPTPERPGARLGGPMAEGGATIDVNGAQRPTELEGGSRNDEYLRNEAEQQGDHD